MENKNVEAKDFLEGIYEAVKDEKLKKYLNLLLDNKKVVITKKDINLLSEMYEKLEETCLTFSYSQNVAGDVLFLIHE